jgi:hypothetical protein
MTASVHIINIEIMTELMLAGHLFFPVLTKRTHYLLRLAASFLICAAIGYYFPVPDRTEALFITFWALFMYSVFFLAVGVSLYICYKDQFWTLLFFMVSAQSVQTLSSSLISALLYGTGMERNSFVYILVKISVLAMTYGSCYLLFSFRLRKNPEILIDRRYQLILLLTAIFAELFLAGAAVGLSVESPSPAYLLIVYLYGALSCLTVLALEFGMLDNKRMEAELLVMDKLLEDEKRQFMVSKDTIQMINLKCHDLKHQIRRLRVSQEDIDRRELQEIENAIGIYDSVARTHNDALDVILTEKSMYCEKENIRLTCMAQGEGLCFMSSTDIYSLFGNALDNAIEAVLQMQDPGKRSISINIRENRQMIVIHMENYFSGRIVMEDGLPVTTKDNRSCHGFGTRSIQRITEKYQGLMSIHTDGDIFYLDIVIPIPSGS